MSRLPDDIPYTHSELRRTVTYDDIGLPGEDDRWDTRLLLHDALEKRFPLMYVNMLLALSGLTHIYTDTQSWRRLS